MFWRMTIAVTCTRFWPLRKPIQSGNIRSRWTFHFSESGTFRPKPFPPLVSVSWKLINKNFMNQVIRIGSVTGPWYAVLVLGLRPRTNTAYLGLVRPLINTAYQGPITEPIWNIIVNTVCLVQEPIASCLSCHRTQYWAGGLRPPFGIVPGDL